MGWGSAFDAAYELAGDAAKMAADQAMSSAQSAGLAVGEAARRVADFAKTASATVATGVGAVRHAASVVASGTANVAGFGANAVTDAAGKSLAMAMHAISAPYRAARQLFAPVAPPEQTAIEPCPDGWPAKKARLEKRARTVEDGRASTDPASRAAAERLAKNNEAVELARLSEDSYRQYDPERPVDQPPAGWHAMSTGDLEAKGISPDLVQKSRAVIYQTPDDWPGGPKTVLAFRGTADLEDGIVDHDQALGVETEQYRSAIELGRQVGRNLWQDVQVTGHSLGGGKAQAAGIAGKMAGSMFNAAGPAPESTGGRTATVNQFTQFRTTGDPLTGVQNSPALQAAIVGVVGPIGMLVGGGAKAAGAIAERLGFGGLSPEAADYADKAFKALPRAARNVMLRGEALPASQGAIHEVPAVDDRGKPIASSNLAGQHSITSVVNGIEQQKREDLATLNRV